MKDHTKYVLEQKCPISKEQNSVLWHCIVAILTASLGRAIAEAVSRWLPTAAARVQSRVWSSGICGGQSGVMAGFLRVLWFPLPFIPPISPSSHSPGSGTIAQWGAYVPSGPRLHSTPPIQKKKKKKKQKKNSIIKWPTSKSLYFRSHWMLIWGSNHD
jgi:hypothetical protein